MPEPTNQTLEFLKKINLIRTTLFFSIAGIFIPGFTAKILIDIELLLRSKGIDCITSWYLVLTGTIVLAIILPFLFYIHIKKLPGSKLASIELKLTLFNLLEYICIQSSLTPLFTNGHTHCYVTDGQNGLELVFTAWSSLPVLIILSYFYDKTVGHKTKLTEKLQIFTLMNFQIATNGSDGGHSYILTEINFKGNKRNLAVFFASKMDEQKLKGLTTIIVRGELVDDGPQFSLHLVNAQIM